jgi:DNA-binding beta-propeller fold protein YncE
MNKTAISYKQKVVITTLTILLIAITALPQVFAATTYTYALQWGNTGSGDEKFGQAWGIAVDQATGNVYVVDKTNCCVKKFDSNGNFLSSIGSSGTEDGHFSHPYNVAVDNLGYIYVADGGNNRIQKFDNAGNFLQKIVSPASGSGAFLGLIGGITVDSSGNIYFSNSAGTYSYIMKYDKNGNFITQWGGNLGTGDREFNVARGVAVDSSNNIYVLDQLNHRVQKFDSNGNFLTKFSVPISIGGGLFGIAVDIAGNIFVPQMSNTNFYVDKVFKFDNNGNLLCEIGSNGNGDGEFKGAMYMATYGYNVIYVADLGNNRIEKFVQSPLFVASEPPYGLIAAVGAMATIFGFTCLKRKNRT